MKISVSVVSACKNLKWHSLSSCVIVTYDFLLANDENGDGAAGGDDVSYVVDIVDHFGLKEIELKKAAWGAYIKSNH